MRRRRCKGCKGAPRGNASPVVASPGHWIGARTVPLIFLALALAATAHPQGNPSASENTTKKKRTGVLHPPRKPVTPALHEAGRSAAARHGGSLEDIEVRSRDGVLLRGWKIRPREPNGDWVLLLHGVADNRGGVLGHGQALLRHGYGVVLMDARAHGASEGDMATYGWLERHDAKPVADALFASEHIHCLFALGESMGAAILLQAAAEEPRIHGVVAEASFANFREVGYDYMSLGMGSWLGRFLLRPLVSLTASAVEKEGGFNPQEVSPEQAVAKRPFPIFLIYGEKDWRTPRRHGHRIMAAAQGPKAMWVVPKARHTEALGRDPAGFERRTVEFLAKVHADRLLGTQ